MRDTADISKIYGTETVFVTDSPDYIEDIVDEETNGTNEIVLISIEDVEQSAPKFERGIAKLNAEALEEIRHRYPNGYIAYMRPDDFLSLTSLEWMRKQIEEESLRLEAEPYMNSEEPIMLKINGDGKVTEHDGRHRMAALRNAGIEKAAVILDAPGTAERAFKYFELKGQKFGEDNPSVVIQEAYSLRKNSADRLESKFAGGLEEAKENRGTEADSEEPANFMPGTGVDRVGKSGYTGSRGERNGNKRSES